MLRRLMMVIAPLALAWLPGCGSDSSTQPSASPSPATPSVSSAASADPAAARPSSDPGYVWATSFTVTLTESAGVAVTVRAVSADLQQAAGGIVIAPPTGLDETFRYQVKASGNRLAANGTLAVDFDFLYTLPNEGREALVTITFTLADDAGSPYTLTTQVKVA